MHAAAASRARPCTARTRAGAVLAALAGVLLAGGGVASAQAWGPWSAPAPVAIAGHTGGAEEPFISPDGSYLLFNGSEALPDFSLQFATRVSAQSFEYQGELLGEGVNELGSFSGVPSLDEQGELYFISNRSYAETLATVYGSQFSAGRVTGVHLVAGLSPETPGLVDFDVGVSYDGSQLYVSVGQFGPGGGPTSAGLALYDRDGGAFTPDPDGAAILRAVNAVGELVYAADLSSDGRELFFTASSPARGEAPAIYRATRAAPGEPFAGIEAITAISGFAEAPSLSADGSTLYYHERVGEEFEIESVTRAPAVAPPLAKLTPKKGAAAGHTTVKITGSAFSSTSAVMFGSIPAAGFLVDSPTTITAESPPGTSGPVEVTVTTPLGRSASSARDRFTYEAPTVTAVSPAAGPLDGLAGVTVTGSGFALGRQGTTLSFGSAAGQGVDCLSPSTCSVTAPATDRAGTVDVRATVGGKSSRKGPADHFTYE